MNEVRRSPEEIEREISEIRAQIDHTLDAVQEKLSPGELLDQALTYVKDETGVFAGNFGRAVRDNPIPATLLGVSIAWLAMAGRSGPASRYEHPPERWRGDGDGRDLVAWKREELKRKGETLAHQASETATDVRERASAVASSVSATAADMKDHAGYMYDTAAHRLSEARDRARAGWETTRREVMHGGATTADFLKSNPLAMVALGLAAGAVAAALIPRTRREDEIMGEHRDALVDEVREAASAAAGPVAETAEEGIRETADAATHALEESYEKPRNEDSEHPIDDAAPDSALPTGPRPATT